MGHDARGLRAPAYAPIAQRFQETRDLRGFVERNLERAADPAVAFYVSQALEECSVARPFAADEERPGAWNRKAASFITEIGAEMYPTARAFRRPSKFLASFDYLNK